MNYPNNLNQEKKSNGFLSGLTYGLIPHIGCVAFIIFAILGVTTATAIFKPLLLNPYFFYILIALSLVFATISAFFYLKRQNLCRCDASDGKIEFIFSLNGIKKKWKYLTILYGTTISVNLVLFMLIFPVLATIDAENGLSFTAVKNVFIHKEASIKNNSPSVTLEVAIPCPGHAPLITGELEAIAGINNIQYRFPNKFIVSYNANKTSQKEILSLDVFKTYKAIIINEAKS